jgi:L-proline amide hydrolase
MQTTEDFAKLSGWKTWYRITGDLKSAKTPLVILHGGPGCTHDYVDAFADLAATGRAVIHYDQLGNGKSTHLPEKGPDFWTVDLFLDELDNLLAHLGIAENYAILGQSWGGMLGAEHAVRRPKGLRSLVIANSPASMVTWVAEANRLRAGLPPEVQAELLRHEKAGTTDDPAYEAAVDVFNAHHVCRVVPMPAEVTRTFDAIVDVPTGYLTMNGPSEFHVIGTMKDWTIVDRLDRIDVPVLLISGRYDEATEACVQPYADHIADVRWTIFKESSHMPHVEERNASMKVVGDFLDETEKP